MSIPSLTKEVFIAKKEILKLPVFVGLILSQLGEPKSSAIPSPSESALFLKYSDSFKAVGSSISSRSSQHNFKSR